MKQFILSTLTLASIFSFISCERHSWENSSEGKKDGTKNLYPAKEKSGHDDHGKEGGESSKVNNH